MIATQIVSHSF